MRHPEDYVEDVLTCVEQVPPGRVTTYGAIAEAVQSYFDTVESPRIQGMSARIGAATSGVVSATEAYVTGDLAMAADAQAASIAAATPASLPLGTD